MKLREYQEQSVEELREGYRSGATRQLLQAPTGAGKTVIFSFITQRSMEKGLKTLILAHRSEILEQISRCLTTVGVPHGMIQSATRIDPSKQVQVASVQTLVRRFDKAPVPDFVVVDECFPPGTMISTPWGSFPIEQIEATDVVLGFDGTSRCCEMVVGVMKRKTDSLVRVTLKNGGGFTCTPNHPIMTDEGWCETARLTPESMVLTITEYESMHDMRGARETESLPDFQMQVGTVSEDNPVDVQKTRRRNNEVPKNKRNARPENKGARINIAQSIGVQAEGKGRKREATTATSNGDGLRPWLGHGSGNSHKTTAPLRVSDLLQSGYWKQGSEGWSRSGRGFSPTNLKTGTGLKEGHFLSYVGVESVEVLKSGSDGEFEKVCPGGVVYNFETTNSHTYIANGVVVHNCHHSCAGQWASVFAQYPRAKFLGVTATPERLDGKGLGDFYQRLVRGPEVSWLIEQGYLAKPIYYAPSKEIDFTGVRKVAGDFSKSQTADIMDRPSITGDMVSHYKRLASGRKFIAFAISLEHAAHIADQFNAAGVSTAVIDGRLNSEDRRKRVTDLESGAITGLVSCELIAEGFDLCSVGCALLGRPTASLGLHLQQLGRPLRPKTTGDNTCIILDHVGNVLRHGLAEEPRDWSLEGNSAKRRKKEAVIETRQCPKCYAIYQGTQCPQCGEVRVSKAREIEIKEGELKQIEAREMAEHRKNQIEVWKCKTFPDLMVIQKARGFKNGWAYMQWQRHKNNPANRRVKANEAVLI